MCDTGGDCDVREMGAEGGCVCVGKWEVGGEYGGQQKAMVARRLLQRKNLESATTKR